MIAVGTVVAIGAWLTTAVVLGGRTPCQRFGHHWIPSYTPTRLYLTCHQCGTTSPGWDLFVTPPGCEHFAAEVA